MSDATAEERVTVQVVEVGAGREIAWGGNTVELALDSTTPASAAKVIPKLADSSDMRQP